MPPKGDPEAPFRFTPVGRRTYTIYMDKKAVLKKNPCPDCTFCQYCSKTRCSMCLPKGCKKPKKENSNKIHIPLFRPY